MNRRGDTIGWRIPALYGDELAIVPVPNDEEPGQGALEIGGVDTIGGSGVILNRKQVEELVADLEECLRTWPST